MKILIPKGQIMLLFAFTTAVFVCCPAASSAQLPIKGVYTTRYKATSGSTYVDNASAGYSPAGSYTYKYGTLTVTSNNYQRLDTFTVANGAGTSVYVFDTVATPVVKIRRVNNAWVTGARKAVWMESDGNTPSATVAVGLRPAYDDSLENIFTKRLFNMGVDNAFENNTGTNNNNIERIDFIFTKGLKAINPDSAGFAVFDRGAFGGNDSFMIAAIKSLDINGDPSDYYPAVKVGPLNYGNAAGTTLNFHAMRKDPSDPDLRLFIAATNQARQGVYFSFRALGFNFSSATSGMQVFGYSVMATDVNLAAPGTPKNMVNYTNATIFPTNTELGSVGGLDMVAVGGVAATTSTFSMLVLPVVMSDFGVALRGTEALVGWQQSAGNDLSALLLERSSDGISFSPVLTIPQPVNAGPRSAVDAHPLQGVNYYRLRIVDNAGDISYTPVVKLIINAPAAGPAHMNIYPMPVTNRQLVLEAAGLGTASCTLEITDLPGRAAFRLATTGARLAHMQITLPGSLPAGIYTLRISDAGGATLLAKKLLLQ